VYDVKTSPACAADVAAAGEMVVVVVVGTVAVIGAGSICPTAGDYPI